jgi:tRNA(fMet)-specific endonuclease VapC
VNRFLIDTDILSLYQREHPAVSVRIEAALRSRSVAVPLTVVAEQLAGRLAQLHSARTPADIARTSQLLSDAVLFFGNFPIQTTTPNAIEIYRSLRALKLNVGSNDLRIAAAALDAGAVVVTRNARDFGRVPGLTTADWSAAAAE